ncbi:MAG: glycosyltransferase family 4 protein [Proteobacteria bacterium]|nr:glycosyltransferase family 4 protein [Pseudomonadota bacterium]
MSDVSQSKRTVLQVLPSLVSGGVERGTIDVAAALVRAGWRALVVSEGGPLVRELDRAGAEHIVLPLNTKNPKRVKENVARIKEVIRSENVSLVHARSRAPGWSAREAAKETGVPFVTTFHGIYSLGPFGLKKLYNRVMADGEIVIAVSNFVREHIMENYKVPSSRIRVIHRGIDTAGYDEKSVTSTRLIQIAQKWRLQEAGQVIMLPGRLTALKGHDVLIDALAELKRRRGGTLDVRCLMVGQGAPGVADRIMSSAAARRVEGHVQVIQDCNDMPAAYMVTDVAVVASTRPEAFGRVIAEAQAMGRPVVACSHGPTSEIIEPGVTGWMFTASDPVSLADALERALSLSRDERAALAKRASERARALFNKDEMCAKTLAVYEEVLARHPAA